MPARGTMLIIIAIMLMTMERKRRRWSNLFVLTTAGASSTEISSQATGVGWGILTATSLQEQTWGLHKSDAKF